MITIDELRKVPLFAALPDDEAETLEGSMAIAFIHQFLSTRPSAAMAASERDPAAIVSEVSSCQ